MICGPLTHKTRSVETTFDWSPTPQLSTRRRSELELANVVRWVRLAYSHKPFGTFTRRTWTHNYWFQNRGITPNAATIRIDLDVGSSLFEIPSISIKNFISDLFLLLCRQTNNCECGSNTSMKLQNGHCNASKLRQFDFCFAHSFISMVRRGLFVETAARPFSTVWQRLMWNSDTVRCSWVMSLLRSAVRYSRWPSRWLSVGLWEFKLKIPGTFPQNDRFLEADCFWKMPIFPHARTTTDSSSIQISNWDRLRSCWKFQ